MSFFALKSPLTASDRIERRRLIFADTLSLVTLFAITALLAVLTNYLYQSYASHQVELANRWLERGEQAMRDGKPQAAIDALSSALAFAPGDRNTEIKLAEALASAGRLQEAAVYFNALLESQQGSGLINLQLARLAARQDNVNQAIEDYQRAIYGNWEGDGYVRRRDVRFELINYLIDHQLLDRARSELLVASGNAPAGRHQHPVGHCPNDGAGAGPERRLAPLQDDSPPSPILAGGPGGRRPHRLSNRPLSGGKAIPRACPGGTRRRPGTESRSRSKS